MKLVVTNTLTKETLTTLTAFKTLQDVNKFEREKKVKIIDLNFVNKQWVLLHESIETNHSGNHG